MSSTLLPALLVACAAATPCPDATWLPWGGKCYSKRGRGTHAECAALCGPNASLAHVESELENEFVAGVAGGEPAWIGYYKIMFADSRDPGFWGQWSDSEEDGEAFTKWARDQPDDGSNEGSCGGAENCAVTNLEGRGLWNDAPCAWPHESKKPACLCEFPAATTVRYLDAVPLLEEDCEEDVVTRNVIFYLVAWAAVAVLEAVHARKKTREAPPIVPVALDVEGEPTTRDEQGLFDRRASRINGRRASRIAALQHLARLQDEPVADAAQALQIKNIDCALVMSGMRAPSCFKGTRLGKVLPQVARVMLIGAMLAFAAFEWSKDSALSKLAAAWCFVLGLGLWVLHATLASMLVDDPAHLLSVIAPLKRDDAAWETLRVRLNPKLLLRFGFVFALVYAVSVATNPRHPLHFGGVVLASLYPFLNLTIIFGLVALFVIALRLLSAGHARLLIELEQNVVKLLRETAEGDTRALSSAIDAAEAHVTGAMSVSNRRMQTSIWVTLVSTGMTIFTMLVVIKYYAGMEQTAQVQGALFVVIGILALVIWELQALLNLLRSVGDALLDLVEEMQKTENLAHAGRFFPGESSALAHRFRSQETARKLTWVLLTEPITSATMYKAGGGVVLSSAVVFLPGLMRAFG